MDTGIILSSLSPFFSLPGEVRILIYEHYLGVDGGYICDNDAFASGVFRLRTNHGPIDQALIFTCKQAAKEMRGIGLRVNGITFTTVDLTGELGRRHVSFQRLWLTNVEISLGYFVHYVGGCLKPASAQRLKAEFPQYGPLVDRIMAEKGSPHHRRRKGTYGEAPSFHRRFSRRAMQYAQVDEPTLVAWAVNKAWRFHLDENPSEAMPDSRVDADSIINCCLEPWDDPSDKNIAKLQRIGCLFPRRLAQQNRPGINTPRFRISAAAVAISFLRSAFKRDAEYHRQCIRRIVLHEDRLASFYPQCHALGLVETCKKNPLLRIERRVSLRHNVFWSLIDVFDTPGGGLSYSMVSASVSYFLGPWITEALALKAAGMPRGCFTLLLDGSWITERAPGMFDAILSHDVVWREARDRCLRQSNTHGLSWFDQRQEKVDYRPGDGDFMGYIFQDFPRAMRDIAAGRSVVKINFHFRPPPQTDLGRAFMGDEQKYRYWDRKTWDRGWLIDGPNPSAWDF